MRIAVRFVAAIGFVVLVIIVSHPGLATDEDLDNTFGDNGTVQVDFHTTDDGGFGVAQQME